MGVAAEEFLKRRIKFFGGLPNILTFRRRLIG